MMTMVISKLTISKVKLCGRTFWTSVHLPKPSKVATYPNENSRHNGYNKTGSQRPAENKLSISLR